MHNLIVQDIMPDHRGVHVFGVCMAGCQGVKFQAINLSKATDKTYLFIYL